MSPGGRHGATAGWRRKALEVLRLLHADQPCLRPFGLRSGSRLASRAARPRAVGFAGRCNAGPARERSRPGKRNACACSFFWEFAASAAPSPHAGMPDRVGRLKAGPRWRAGLRRLDPAAPGPATRSPAFGVRACLDRVERHAFGKALLAHALTTLSVASGAPNRRPGRLAVTPPPSVLASVCRDLGQGRGHAQLSRHRSPSRAADVGVTPGPGVAFPMRGLHLDTPRKQSRKAGRGSRAGRTGSRHPGRALRGRGPRQGLP